MSNTMPITPNKPFWVDSNKGSYEILPSSDNQVHYEIVRGEHRELVRIERGANRLAVHVPEQTHSFKMRIWIPRHVALKCNLENGVLNLNGLEGNVYARIEHGALEFVPTPKPNEIYQVDLGILSGTLFYHLAGIPAALKMEVQIGVANITQSCQTQSSRRIGYTGEERVLQCGHQKPFGYRGKLTVKQGTITVR